ncbi:MAG: dTDP-4-dehydrorhamnose 3,5-epimerase, partial [uncultured Gemmatimonadetes bacterium]
DLSRDPHPRRLAGGARAHRGRARVLCAGVRRGRVRAAGNAHGVSAVQRELQRARRDAAGASLPGGPARRGQAGALHRGRRVGRAGGPAPGVARLPALVRRRAERRQPPHAVRSRGGGARLPDAGGRFRGVLPDLGAVPPGAGPRPALGRPGLRHRVARGRRPHHLGTGPRLRGLRRV